MKKKITATLFLLLFVIMCFMLMVACVDKSNNGQLNNNQASQKVEVELNSSNYFEYLEIRSSMDSQTYMLLYNTYLVWYQYGSKTYYQTVQGLTPPTGSSIYKCEYVSSLYSIRTTISVHIKATSTEYSFSKVKLRLKFPYSGIFLIELNVNGVGLEVLNFEEQASLPYKSYSLSTTVMSVNGTVTYYETVE